jgi:hypothetical protein
MKFGAITMIDVRTIVLANVMPCSPIQGDARGKTNIMGRDSIDYCEKNEVRMNTCLILNGY